MKNTFIGAPMERREDLRFLRGRGTYVDDLKMPGLLYAVILRSSVAHGRLVSIDASAALKIAGVHAVITAKDMPRGIPGPADRADAVAAAAGIQAVRAAGYRPRESALRRRADRGGAGRRVAVGEDALEAIAVEIEELPAVADWQTAARESEACCSRPPAPTARSCSRRARATPTRPSQRRPTSAASACAPAATTASPWSRAASWPNGTRPRASSPCPAPRKCRSSTAASCAKQIGLPEDAIEMIENDVGGGYGARGEFYPEDFLIPFAARHVNRPVKWIEDRRENLMAMNHAREEECDLEVACHARRHHPRHARRGPHRHGRLHAHQRRGRRAQRAASSWPGRIACPHDQDQLASVDDQQDAGRHLPRAGSLRRQLLHGADDRHDRGRSRHRPHRVSAART